MSMNRRLRIPDLMKMVDAGEKIVMVTAYDFLTASIADAAGVDMLLVGDSLGTVILGYDTTIPVTMEDVLHHSKPVVRAAKRAIVVADMPFGSYQTSIEAGVENAIRLVKEGGVSAVKLEGGKEMLPVIRAICNAGVPVIGHIGLLPQTAPLCHGYHSHGRDEDAARELADVAVAMEEAGVFAILMECVAKEAAALVTEKVDIPTIGIGSGVDCDGQVLVSQDLLGMNNGHLPVFVKKYADLAGIMQTAYGDFIREVKAKEYPAHTHSFQMEEGEARKLY